MQVSIIWGIIGVALGFGLSYLVPESGSKQVETGTEDSGMSETMKMEAESDGHSHTHSHDGIETNTSLPVPTVSVEALTDTKDGYNLRIETDNFTWTPESVNGEPVEGQGHAHVYVGETKIARIYNGWFHLSADYLEMGENTIRVTLNANDHREWTVDGGVVEATTVVTKK